MNLLLTVLGITKQSLYGKIISQRKLTQVAVGNTAPPEILINHISKVAGVQPELIKSFLSSNPEKIRAEFIQVLIMRDYPREAEKALQKIDDILTPILEREG